MKPNQAKRRARKHKYKEQAARRKAEADKQQPLQLELPVSMPEQETAAEQAKQESARQPKDFQVASSRPQAKPAETAKALPKPKAETRKPAAKPAKESQPSFKPAPGKKAKSPVWRLYLALLITGLLTIWFSQDSINAYWQQTYHRASPLEKLHDYAWWRAGSRWQQASLRQHEAALGWLDEQNESWRQQHAAQSQQAAVLTPLAPPEGAAQSASQPASASVPANGGETIAQARPDRVQLTAGDKVFFAGDSMMEGVAPHVQRWLSSQYGIDSVNLSRQSTGLSYPSFFDWPATIEKTLREDQKIRLLVVFLGPNDPWDFPNPQPGTRGYLKFQSPEWEQAYRQRIERIVTAAKAANVRLIWMGVPLMKNRRLNAQMRYLDELFASELAGKSIWLPTDKLMGGEDGQYRDSITLNGQAVRLRSKDGIHFTIKGQQLLAEQIASRIDYRPASANEPGVPAAASETMAARGK